MKREKTRSTKPARSSNTVPEVDPRFALVVEAFAKDRRVTYGGKGFGSTALKADGKIFAMVSSKGSFVVKLPRERADELVHVGQGHYFDPGRGRLMKQWIAVAGEPSSWLDLAREACQFAKAQKG